MTLHDRHQAPCSAGHRRLRAQLGPWAVRGPCAGHTGAARHCTKRRRRLRAQLRPWAARGPQKLSVDACTSLHHLPRDPFETASGPEELRASDSEQSHGCRRSARLLSISCTGGHCNGTVAIILFASRHLSLRGITLEYPRLPLSAGPRVLKQTARKLVSPVQLQPIFVCGSR